VDEYLARDNHRFIFCTSKASLIAGPAFIFLRILHGGALAPVLGEIEVPLAETKALGSRSPRIFPLIHGL
jgi:hypothetical protein